MKIYLADLAHRVRSTPFFAPQTTPLGIGYLKASLETQVSGCEVLLFRDPDELLTQVQEDPPQLMGLTLTSWNSDLSSRVVGKVKEWLPTLPVVVGGPSVDDTDGELVEVLSAPGIDFAVPSEGEGGVVALAQHLELDAATTEPIDGVAFLDAKGALVRGEYKQTPLPDIPSPYLGGALDVFLNRGMVPIVQTMRGCPYRCEFCVSGTEVWSPFSGYPLEHVRAELEYVAAKVPHNALILTDENFGILKERDIELAEYLVELRRHTGFPSRVYYYTAKVVTTHCRRIAELLAPFAWIGGFPIAFQTLNREAKKAVKRTNIALSKLDENVQWGKKSGVKISSDMVSGFPHETPESFMMGIETLLEAGVDRVNAYPLQLFPGIDLYTPARRHEYNIQTGHRPIPDYYGIYWNGEIVSAETEEVVTGTRWCDFDDYLRLRRYLLFNMMVLGKDYFHEMMSLGFAAGLPMFRLPRHLAQASFEDYPACAELIQAFNDDVGSEFSATREEAYELARRRLRDRSDVAGMKPNLVYIGRMLGSEESIYGLVAEMGRFVRAQLGDCDGDDPVLNYLYEVLPHRLMRLSEGTRIHANHIAFEPRPAPVQAAGG